MEILLLEAYDCINDISKNLENVVLYNEIRKVFDKE